jgi:hypothetical protein
VQAMHRVRDRLVQRPTALINQIRGFLLECGITFSAHPIHLRKNLPGLIEDAEQNLSSRLCWLLAQLWQEWKQLEIDVQTITDEIERNSLENAHCQRLRQIPVSARWSRVRWWLRSGTEQPFCVDVTSPPGSGLCPGNTPPGVSRSCSKSASAAMSICVAC